MRDCPAHARTMWGSLQLTGKQRLLIQDVFWIELVGFCAHAINNELGDEPFALRHVSIIHIATAPAIPPLVIFFGKCLQPVA
jgi:hypothetical protein